MKNGNVLRIARLVLLFVLVGLAHDGSCQTRITSIWRPGSPDELAALVNGGSSSVVNGARQAASGAGWTYKAYIPARSTCTLSYSYSVDFNLTISTGTGRDIPLRKSVAAGKTINSFVVPDDQPISGTIRFQFVNTSPSPASVNFAELKIILNGTSSMESLMGVAAGKHAQFSAIPPRPHTAFQTGQNWSPTIAIPTDALFLYSKSTESTQSWTDAGYIAWTMGGFRENRDYAKTHPDGVQMDANGKPLIIGDNSFYMVPTLPRNKLSADYYIEALKAGSTGACPEEPELFGRSGYSQSFKNEWEAEYHAPWSPPHSSLESRYMAETLKAKLTVRQVETILTAVQNASAASLRMLAVHSPVTYYDWGITLPHHALFQLPQLREVVGQVWTGTARTPNRSAGVRTERTFDLALLEYSSLVHLLRGTDKNLWFLMDPVEDNPNLPMEDYHKNYEQTLTAALMFPAVDSYEVMPWPERVYGRVPPDYATVINTVVGALSEMWKYSDGVSEAGSTAIGTFVSDSMGLERQMPEVSDFDGFHALCMPLVTHGIPVEVLSLDRAAEPGYLNRIRTLLLSYNFLKPAGPEIHRALAEWVKSGRSLIIVGSGNQYDRLQSSWWKKAGSDTSTRDLLSALDLAARTSDNTPRHPESIGQSSLMLQTVLQSETNSHDLKNRATRTVDLTSLAHSSGSAWVQFEDNDQSDGWGTALFSVDLRIDGKPAAAFRTGSEVETRFLAVELDTRFNGLCRSADRKGKWAYRFDNLPRDKSVTLTLDIGNSFLVKAGQAPKRTDLMTTDATEFGPTLRNVWLSQSYAIQMEPSPKGAKLLYRSSNRPIIWESRVGSGTVTYAGIEPAWFTSSAQTSRLLRELVKRAHENALGNYRESSHFSSRRGPYRAIKALGSAFELTGTYVNLLSPTLNVVEDPTVPAKECGFFQATGPLQGAPHLIASSGRLKAKYESEATTSILVMAPTGTIGAARLYKGAKTMTGIKAFSITGEPLSAQTIADGNTILVKYPNRAEGIVILAGWK